MSLTEEATASSNRFVHLELDRREWYSFFVSIWKPNNNIEQFQTSVRRTARTPWGPKPLDHGHECPSRFDDSLQSPPAERRRKEVS